MSLGRRPYVLTTYNRVRCPSPYAYFRVFAKFPCQMQGRASCSQFQWLIRSHMEHHSNSHFCSSIRMAHYLAHSVHRYPSLCRMVLRSRTSRGVLLARSKSLSMMVQNWEGSWLSRSRHGCLSSPVLIPGFCRNFERRPMTWRFQTPCNSSWYIESSHRDKNCLKTNSNC